MFIEIVSDEQLTKLISTDGYLVNIDYPTKDIKLHKTSCRFCDPRNSGGVKVDSKRANNTGEFWFSESSKEASKKANEIAMDKGYAYSTCSECNPV